MWEPLCVSARDTYCHFPSPSFAWGQCARSSAGGHLRQVQENETCVMSGMGASIRISMRREEWIMRLKLLVFNVLYLLMCS